MNLQIQERQSGDASILELKGRLVMGAEADAVHKHVKKLLGENKKKIILQLQNVTHMDSGGFGALAASVSSARSASAKIHFLKLSKRAEEVFRLVGLGVRPDLFPVFTDEQEAVRNF